MSNRAGIELHVPDFEIVKDFYQKIGFQILWEQEPDQKKGYLVMALEDNVLRFWCGNKEVYQHSYFQKFPESSQPGYGVEIVLQINQIQDYYNQIKDQVSLEDQLSLRPWGLQDFRIKDPFGFYLRITEPHDIRETFKVA